MFVVWRFGRRRLSARLVENRRVDGQPRQRFIAVLGSIDLHYITTRPRDEYTTKVLCDFWSCIEEALDRLDLKPADRSRIRAAVADRVRPPSAEEVDAWKAKLKAMGLG